MQHEIFNADQANTKEVTVETARNTVLSLNKNRLEAFSDGVFSIVMTLLVIEIKVPEIHHNHATSWELFLELRKLYPLFTSYFLSVAVLAWLWLAHHFLFHYHAKTINRGVVLLNILFLSFVSLIPFSAHLLGSYFYNQTATIVYGLNILLVSASQLLMYKYIWRSKDVENGTMSSRVKKQGQVRMWINIISISLGILFSFLYTPVSYFFYGFPVIFNITPGLLNLAERIFGFEIK